jgi:ubiquinone/menaquinone biosynthesis C-methylase UbiE
MPSSHHQQLNEIVELIRLTDPQKMLDIGTGFGKFGFLAREYLELWDGREQYRDWQRQIDGIEAFESYLGPVHESIYTRVYKGDALQVLPALAGSYDLVLLIDVLEHFTREEGLRVLEQCARISRNVLVSVPVTVSEQENAFGNPWETHRSRWAKKDFSGFAGKFFLPNPRSLICYFGEDGKKIGALYRKSRSHQVLVLLLEYLALRAPVKKILGRS